MQKISISEFFQKTEWPTLIDVRSPGEYGKAHMPSAKNLPLFTDEERAVVGTLYKQKGADVAMMKGLDLAGKKMTDYVRLAQKLIEGKKVAIHCWRGGSRSASMATLLEFTGFEVELLTGGYKAYRNHVLHNFAERKLDLIVLGGQTGSGKTEVLHELEKIGEQIIDLEGVACHRGSAFGALGMEEQPTSEQFENNLFEHFRKLDPARRVWVENESRSVGKVIVPQGLWDQMEVARFVEIEVPIEGRLKRLTEDYGHFPEGQLIECLEKLTRRMGGQNVKAAKEAFAGGDLKTATTIALEYYDRGYSHATSKKHFSEKHSLKFDTADSRVIAQKLAAFADETLEVFKTSKV